MAKQIELDIEKMNHGHWLKVNVPYISTLVMTATVQNTNGELLKTVKLATGNNLIDMESIKMQTVRIKIDTPYETLLKEIFLD